MNISLDLDALSSSEMVAYFVLQCREQGVTLPYNDYRVIETWLETIGRDHDSLLLILADLLPAYYAKKKGRVKPSLKGIDRSVRSRIKSLAIRHVTGPANVRATTCAEGPRTIHYTPTRLSSARPNIPE